MRLYFVILVRHTSSSTDAGNYRTFYVMATRHLALLLLWTHGSTIRSLRDWRIKICASITPNVVLDWLKNKMYCHPIFHLVYQAYRTLLQTTTYGTLRYALLPPCRPSTHQLPEWCSVYVNRRVGLSTILALCWNTRTSLSCFLPLSHHVYQVCMMVLWLRSGRRKISRSNSNTNSALVQLYGRYTPLVASAV